MSGCDQVSEEVPTTIVGQINDNPVVTISEQVSLADFDSDYLKGIESPAISIRRNEDVHYVTFVRPLGTLGRMVIAAGSRVEICRKKPSGTPKSHDGFTGFHSNIPTGDPVFIGFMGGRKFGSLLLISESVYAGEGNRTQVARLSEEEIGELIDLLEAFIADPESSGFPRYYVDYLSLKKREDQHDPDGRVTYVYDYAYGDDSGTIEINPTTMELRYSRKWD